MARFALTREAGHDLSEIEDYTARRWGDDQARHYIDALFEAFEALAQNPAAGRRRTDIPPPYLVHAVGSHLIIYRINTRDDRVEILNILHPAMDLPRRLADALRRNRPPQ